MILRIVKCPNADCKSEHRAKRHEKVPHGRYVKYSRCEKCLNIKKK